jgi:hypothetical protein
MSLARNARSVAIEFLRFGQIQAFWQRCEQA